MNLTGGFYDAGDNVKFGFPMAFTITLLNWAALDYECEISSVNQLGYLRSTISWGTDFLVRAHTSPTTLYTQVQYLWQIYIHNRVWCLRWDISSLFPILVLTVDLFYHKCHLNLLTRGNNEVVRLQSLCSRSHLAKQSEKIKFHGSQPLVRYRFYWFVPVT